jgi:hypothetical protein
MAAGPPRPFTASGMLIAIHRPYAHGHQRETAIVDDHAHRPARSALLFAQELARVLRAGAENAGLGGVVHR